MRRRVLLFLAFLLLTILMALLLGGFARDALIPGFWRVYWGVRTLIENLPQVPIWDLLVAALLVLAASSLLRRRQARREERGKGVEYQGRVQMLARWIQRATQGEYFKWNLAHNVGGIALEVLAYREHATVEQVRQRLREGRLDLPPEIRAYLMAGQSPRFTRSNGLLRRFRHRWLRPAPSFSLDPALLELVQLLEEQLEIGGQQVGSRARSQW